MRFTGPLTRRRREAIALAAREQMNAATARMQRNVYRDHLLRLAEALDDVNRAWAAPPASPALAPWSVGEADRVTQALHQARGMARMARQYDATQQAAEAAPLTVQEN